MCWSVYFSYQLTLLYGCVISQVYLNHVIISKLVWNMSSNDHLFELAVYYKHYNVSTFYILMNGWWIYSQHCDFMVIKDCDVTMPIDRLWGHQHCFHVDHNNERTYIVWSYCELHGFSQFHWNFTGSCGICCCMTNWSIACVAQQCTTSHSGDLSWKSHTISWCHSTIPSLRVCDFIIHSSVSPNCHQHWVIRF